MSAFFALFENNSGIVRDFLEEKFWVDLFKFQSVSIDSNIPKQKGVFSERDLLTEIDILFEHYQKDIYKDHRGIEGITDEIIEKRKISDKKEIKDIFITQGIDYLIQRNGIFLGMKVSCMHCGSNTWYSLNELNEKIQCKGCKNEIKPDTSSKIYFKVSDIIINNILGDQAGSKKSFHGNYLVSARKRSDNAVIRVVYENHL